jgi:hypothetical protein
VEVVDLCDCTFIVCCYCFEVDACMASPVRYSSGMCMR